jgi:hypothetical protein
MHLTKKHKIAVASVVRRQGQAVVHLILTAILIASIAAVGTVVSIGFARAQNLNAMPAPDTSLVLGMLAGAVAVMSVLSALAVRFVGRPRHPSDPLRPH